MNDEYVLPQVASEVAKAINMALSSVQSINGVKPDPVTGDVTLSGGTGGGSGGNVDLTGVVRSVNGQSPDENGNVEIAVSGGGKSVYYIATDYGISTDAEDNTPALQTLVNNVSAAGGGIIFFPVGTYNFKKADTKYAVLMKSNVSIMGENIETTILKQTQVAPYSLFYKMGTADEPLTGCCFSNFTVDAYDTGNTNQVYGKAFYIQYLKDCVFRDLRLLGTIASAMGIDFLDRVTIDSINCVDCGRTYTGTQNGTSGIGIGTGGWENENFTISNCICVGSGQYGIFIENQFNLKWGGNVSYAKGCIISNCVVRGGLNNGIGVRGGENVTIIGCETYENTKHGIYLDNKCRNVRVLSCSSTTNGGNGIRINPDAESSRIIVKGCVFVENTAEGIRVETASDKLCISDNHTDENSVGLYIGALTLNDCVFNNNTIMDGTETTATFDGNTDYNDFKTVKIIAPTSIVSADMSLHETQNGMVQYNVRPIEANASVLFESSNTGIATVDSSGKVTGVALGSCTITIRSSVDPSVYTTINCTVSEAPAPTAITADAVSVTVGGYTALSYAVTPEYANKKATFESSNTGIATVDSSGKVTGVALGSCTITIRSSVDPSVYTVVAVVVSNALYPLTDGSFTFDNNSVLTVSNANHIAYSSGSVSKVNFTNLEANNASDVNNNANINFADPIFTIKRGSVVTLDVTNIVESVSTWSVAVRDTNATTWIKIEQADATDGTVTATATEDVNVGCLFLYVSSGGGRFEADVKLTVDGVQWI